MDIDKILEQIKKFPIPNLQTQQQAENAEQTQKKTVTMLNQPARTVTEKNALELPPNLYDEEGNIQAFFGRRNYRTIHKYTSQPLKIYNDGYRRIPCAKCYVKISYDNGAMGKAGKYSACADCRKAGGLTYIDWCNVNAIDDSIRHELYKKGLLHFTDDLSLGYDYEKNLLIFPLNKFQYVTLPFDGQKFLVPQNEALKVLAHYNRPLAQNKNTGLYEPVWHTRQFPFVPYLDNRFIGEDGRKIIAECAAYRDGGRDAQTTGKIIFPFSLK